MAFIDIITEKLGVAAEKTANKAKEIALLTKLNSKISENEKKIQGLFIEIGKRIYDQSEGEGSVEIAEIQVLCEKINKTKALTEELKEKIQEIKFNSSER